MIRVSLITLLVLTAAVRGEARAQLTQYLAAYRAHMAATWNTRVAIMSALKMMDRAMQSSDSDAVRYYHLGIAQLWGQLRTQDQDFEAALGSILRKGELRSYQAWQVRWERGAETQQRLQVALIQSDASDH